MLRTGCYQGFAAALLKVNRRGLEHEDSKVRLTFHKPKEGSANLVDRHCKGFVPDCWQYHQ